MNEHIKKFIRKYSHSIEEDDWEYFYARALVDPDVGQGGGIPALTAVLLTAQLNPLPFLKQDRRRSVRRVFP